MMSLIENLTLIPTAVKAVVMDCIIEKVKDSYLVSLGEGCRCRRFPSRD